MEAVIRHVEEDSIFTPVVPIKHEREHAPMQRMEGVGYLETFWWTGAIRCS